MVEIKKILFITLSNIGDAILTLPVLDALREMFPGAQVTCMVGPRAKEIFENNPAVARLIIFDKHAELRHKARLFSELNKEHFDLIIDLRNTFYGAFLPARYKTSPLLSLAKTNPHMVWRNLYRLQKALRSKKTLEISRIKSFTYSAGDKEYIEKLLEEKNVGQGEKIILISPGTGGSNKRWEAEKFARLCRELSRNYKVILVGSKAHEQLNHFISQDSGINPINFTGVTNLSQLAYLLKRASLLITCDSGIQQLASYLDTPVLSLFGPTDDLRYGPWSKKCRIVKKEIVCRPCKKDKCSRSSAECMQMIKVEDCLKQAEYILGIGRDDKARDDLRRILVVRTDRIGDVVLSTPVLQALRQTYPNAYIAMMTSPYTKDIVEDNPCLDQVIIYDKAHKHKSWHSSIAFARRIKKKRFDLAIILHPSNRVHLVTFLAGIPKRVGYNRKMGFLLTHRLKHKKQLGEKHELDYNLDLLKFLGIVCRDKSLSMAIKPKSEEEVDLLLKQAGIKNSDRLLAVHPAASCRSKMWPAERFGQAADALSLKYGYKTIIIAGPKDIACANAVESSMHQKALNLAGKISVSQLASLLKKCTLFISNDSGPVHISSAVGTPVISIFGRNQKGLSPLRWGPVGRRDSILHKEVGCIECLAHNCKKDFACLKAITVDDVLNCAAALLQGVTRHE